MNTAQQSVTTDPFEFYTAVQLVEATGDSVLNLGEMLDRLRSVSGSVIYCHTFRTMLMQHFITEGFRNDFAFWVGDALGDDELSERLSAIDLIDYTTIRAYREKMISIIEEHLKKHPRAASHDAREHDRFHLCSAHTFVIPTGRRAATLEEFANHLARCSRNSIFFHFVEARLRVGLPINDFSLWIAQRFERQDLADAINRLNPYVCTLDQLRESICALVEQEL
jgi:hypothetical protein